MNVHETRLGAAAPEGTGEHFPDRSSFVQRACTVATAAATEADDVDRDARFPMAAIDVARQQRLLGAQIPLAFGGDGASIADITDMCYMLGRACASTAMIFAMHQIKAACIVRHGAGSAWTKRYAAAWPPSNCCWPRRPPKARPAAMCASVSARRRAHGDDISLDRNATVISYGARPTASSPPPAAPDAAGSDQVLLAITRTIHAGAQPRWETLGMRGTCSVGFELKSRARPNRSSRAYDKIHAQTMTPVAHLCWSSVWAGIAAGAVERAQAFIRNAARAGRRQLPPGAAHFTAAKSSLSHAARHHHRQPRRAMQRVEHESARCPRSTSSP